MNPLDDLHAHEVRTLTPGASPDGLVRQAASRSVPRAPFAWYIAPSARLTRVSGASPPVATAIPMLAEIEIVLPCSSNGRRSAASRRLANPVKEGYVRNLEDRKGHTARYAPGDPLPAPVAALPDPADLEQESEMVV